MKRNDFLQNLLLIILSAILAACIVNLACLGALPVTYTSRAQVQLTGDDLHLSDIRDFGSYVENDELLRTKVMTAYSESGASESSGPEYYVSTKSVPETGIVDVYVTSDDPCVSHAVAKEIVTAAYSDYPASHSGINIHLIDAASVADVSDPLPVLRYTILGALFGAVFGAVLSFLAVRGEREKRRRRKAQDPRFARIEEPDESVYDALFAEDNEDVDPEMRELYRVTKRAVSNREPVALSEENAHDGLTIQEGTDTQELTTREKADTEEMMTREEADRELSGAEEDDMREGHMSEEAEAAYLEAMEIEAMAAGDEIRTEPGLSSDTEQKGGNPYEE